MNTPFKSTRQENQGEAKKRDLIKALEEVERRHSISVNVEVPRDLATKVDEFLKSRSLFPKSGFPLLIEIGIALAETKNLEEARSEMRSQGKELRRGYAQMKFQAYEYFTANKGLTMRLRQTLRENRALKATLVEESHGELVPNDPWDDWDEKRIDEFYENYVFKSRL